MPDPKVYDRLLEDTLGPADPNAQATLEGRYESIFADEDKRSEAALKQASSHATDQPATDAAEASRLAARMGLPVDVVTRNLPAMRSRARLADTDYGRMMRDSPVLSAWLTEENHAAIAQDELPALGSLERSLQFGRRASGAVGAGVLGMSRGFWGLVRAGAEGLDLPGAAAFAKDVAADVSVMQTGLRGDTYGAGAIESGVLSGFESLGQSAAAVPLLFVPGGQGVAAASFTGAMGAATAGQAYADARAAGVDANKALVYAYGQGGVEVLTELLPAHWLLGDLAKNAGLARMLLHQVAAELPGEQVATVFQDLNEWAVLHPDKPFSAYLAERPSAAAQTLIATLVAVGGQTTAVRVLDRAVSGKPTTQRTLEEAGAAAAAAPSTASTPEKLAELVGRMAPAGSPIDTVYLPVDTFVSYFQDRQTNPATIAEALTGSGSALTEALTTGTDLAIPIGRYLEILGRTEHNAYFAQEARFSPDELNAREEGALVTQEGARAAAADLSPQELQAPDTAAIRETVRGQLVDAGVDKRAAEAYAGLHAAAFGTLAQRAGLDPQTLFDRYRLAITREAGPQVPGAQARHVSALDLQRAIEQTRARRGETVQPTLEGVQPGGPTSLEPGQDTGPLAPDQGGAVEGGGLATAPGVEPGGPEARGGTGLEPVPPGGRQPDIPGVPAPGSVPRSTPRRGETPAQRLTRRQRHYSGLTRSILKAARAVDPVANLPAIRNELTFRIQAFEDRQGAYLESGHDPLDLVRSIAERGGLNTEDPTWPGEINWVRQGLRFGAVAGVNGVFTRGGQTADLMITSLQQDARFQWVTDVSVLVDAIDNAVRHPVETEVDRFPGTEDLQEDLGIDPSTAWWTESWSGATEAPAPALELDEDLVGDAIDLEGGDLSFNPADLEGGPFEELNQGPRTMTLEEILGHELPEGFQIVEGAAPIEVEGPGPKAAAARAAGDVEARLATLEARPDISPDSIAVPFESIPQDTGITMYRARDRATRYQTRLPVARLIATQEAISRAELRNYLEARKDPANAVEVLEYKGRYYLVDGTHRATVAWARGEDAITAMVTKVNPAWLEAPPPYRSALEPVPPPPLAVAVVLPEELFQPGVQDYGGEHRPPGPKDGAPANDLTGGGRIYPDDVYDPDGPRVYGTGDAAVDRATFRILKGLKGKPAAKVTIYRSVPVDVDQTEINAGDWVTINRTYAEDHGLRFAETGGEGEAFKILEKTVEAREIFTNGDSIHEWGYWPGGETPDELARFPLAGDQVGGLTVRADVPNLGSIAASLTDYRVLPGVRRINLATEFPGYQAPTAGRTQELAQTAALAEEIRASGEINPMIVVQDKDGLYVLEGAHRFDAAHVLGLAEVPAIVVQDLESLGQTLAQPDRRGGERGVIRIAGDRTMSIALFASADLSTFLHESGHFFLEVFADTAQALQQMDPASLNEDQRRVLADYGATLEQLGAESFRALTPDQKETWARQFEAYLFEGTAPSSELRSMFSRFAAWLRGIYRSLRALRVELTPEVRGVFDRLLATDAAITAAQREARLGPLFLDQATAGMSDEEWAAYQGTIATAREAAETKLRTELLADYNRARQDWWKQERATVRAEVVTALGTQQVYTAMAVIRTGLHPDGTPFIPGSPVAPLKLNKAELVRIIGEGETKKLPRPFLYTTEGGIHPDDAAELLGYSSGQRMIEAIQASEPLEKAADVETDRIMADRHGDKLATGQLEALAREAVDSDHQADLLEAEQRALARKRREVGPFVEAERAAGRRELQEERAERDYERRWFEAEANLRLAIERGAKQADLDELRRRAEATKAELRAGARAVAASVPSTKALRAIAEARINATEVGALRPTLFWNAARRAGTEAIDAAARQQWDRAVEAKAKQRLTLELYRASAAAVDQVAEAREEAAALFKADATLAKSRNMDYVAAARVLAARYFFPARQESALEAIRRIQTYDPDLYDNLEAQIAGALAGAGDLKTLTVENFVGVKDTIAALWALSRRDKQVQIEGRLLEREAVMGELSQRLTAVGLPEHKPGYSQAATKWEKTQMLLLGVRASLRRVEHWVDAVDQGNPAGPFRRFVWTPISDAAAAYRAAKVAPIAHYLELIRPIEATLTPGQIAAPEIGYTFSGRAELLHALLHTGNVSNLQKLLRGRKWGEYQADGTLDTSRWDRFVERLQREGVLTRADYTYTQGVWDLLETLKAPAQQAHRAMYGTYFSELTATPVVTPFGTFRGGYVPAIADPFLAPDAATKSEKASLTEGQNSFMFPTTGRGFTKARVEAYAKPLALDLRLIPQHIDKVLRFVNLEPVVKDVARMVFDPSFRATLDVFDPTVGGDLLVPWLQRSASQRVQTASQGWGGRAADTFFRGVRTRTGLNIMTANVVNTLQQFTGLSLSATQVGIQYFPRALWTYVRGPRVMADAIAAASPWMSTRVSSQAMEIQTTIDDLLLNPSKYDQARAFAARHGYFMQQATQNVVDLVTWSAAYHEATAAGAPELEAVHRADASVRMTQGSFAPEDVSRFETGSPFMRAFAMFFSYFNNQANLLGSKFLTVVRDDVGLRKGAGRALYLYTFGFMAPAVLAEIIRQAVVGFEGDDDDDYLDEVLALFFGSQARAATAFVPILGPAIQATLNHFNDKGWDDRISTSPAVSTLESATSAPASVYKAMSEGRGYKKAIRDTLSAVGLLTGLPVLPFARPLGYAADVAEGRTDPEGPLEVVQGAIAGRAPR